MDPDRNPRISRRGMLRRIGTGAAIVWTVPVVTSIHAPALAQASCNPDPHQCEGCPAPEFSCPSDDNKPCAGPGCQSGFCNGGLGCFVHEDMENCCCRCLQNSRCSCLTPCQSNADCSVGGCIKNTKCGPGGFCMSCCGTNCHSSRGASRRGGRTAA
jgi:hypothetical protein